MIIRYIDNEIFPRDNPINSIFLDGPISEYNIRESWKWEAIKILESLKFDGIVYIPEYSPEYLPEYNVGALENQIFDSTFSVPDFYNFKRAFDEETWRINVLEQVDLIVFWVPSQMKKWESFFINRKLLGLIRENEEKIVYGGQIVLKKTNLAKHLNSLKEVVTEAMQYTKNSV